MTIALAQEVSLHSLTVLDYVLIAVLLYSIVRGFMLGAISELGLLLALVFGTLAAGRLGPIVGKTLVGFGIDARLRAAIGYAIVLAVIWIAARIVTRILRGGARLLMLGFVDRLGGAVFGLLRGGLVVVVVGFLVVHFRIEPWRDQAHVSALIHAVSPVFPVLNGLLPENLRPGPVTP